MSASSPDDWSDEILWIFSSILKWYHISSRVGFENPIHIAGCQGFSGTLHFLKYQIVSHKWNLNFEMSWVCPLIISSAHLPLIFLEEPLSCTLTHHLCYQWCSFKGTSDAITKFITIDTSFTIFGYAGFCHGEWGYVVVCWIQCCRQWYVHSPPSSLCALSVFITDRNTT